MSEFEYEEDLSVDYNDYETRDSDEGNYCLNVFWFRLGLDLFNLPLVT